MYPNGTVMTHGHPANEVFVVRIAGTWVNVETAQELSYDDVHKGHHIVVFQPGLDA